MVYFTTLAWKRGLVSDEDHKRILNLFSRAGLTMDHELFDENVLKKGIEAIYGVRDGFLHAAVPAPLGQCQFMEDVTEEEFNEALKLHKDICSKYPRGGAGLDAYVDASDTGVPEQNEGEDIALKKAAEKAKINGATTNGHANGASNGIQNDVLNGTPVKA
jgi:3-dehydroquinate synthase